jgi:hypothetical protein
VEYYYIIIYYTPVLPKRKMKVPVDFNHHNLGVYATTGEMLLDAFEFLKDGVYNNEVIAFITEDITSDRIYEVFANGLNIEKVDKFDDKDQIITSTPYEWYIINGEFDSDKVMIK